MYKEKNKIFLNGCFYLLHSGHIKLFKTVREIFPVENNTIIVGINSNKSTQLIKNNREEIFSDEDRLLIFNSIKYIDEVYLFDDITPYKLIKKIKPDFLVKGKDYINKYIIGSDIVPNILLIDIYNKYSTTNIIKKIIKGNSDE